MYYNFAGENRLIKKSRANRFLTETKYRVLPHSGSTGQLKWREREQEEERKREGEGEQEGVEDHDTVEQTQEKETLKKSSATEN